MEINRYEKPLMVVVALTIFVSVAFLGGVLGGVTALLAFGIDRWIVNKRREAEIERAKQGASTAIEEAKEEAILYCRTEVLIILLAPRGRVKLSMVLSDSIEAQLWAMTH